MSVRTGFTGAVAALALAPAVANAQIQATDPVAETKSFANEQLQKMDPHRYQEQREIASFFAKNQQQTASATATVAAQKIKNEVDKQIAQAEFDNITRKSTIVDPLLNEIQIPSATEGAWAVCAVQTLTDKSMQVNQPYSNNPQDKSQFDSMTMNGTTIFILETGASLAEKKVANDGGKPVSEEEVLISYDGRKGVRRVMEIHVSTNHFSKSLQEGSGGAAVYMDAKGNIIETHGPSPTQTAEEKTRNIEEAVRMTMKFRSCFLAATR